MLISLYIIVSTWFVEIKWHIVTYIQTFEISFPTKPNHFTINYIMTARFLVLFLSVLLSNPEKILWSKQWCHKGICKRLNYKPIFIFSRNNTNLNSASLTGLEATRFDDMIVLNIPKKRPMKTEWMTFGPLQQKPFCWIKWSYHMSWCCNYVLHL